jgi:uncharacterized protein YndB with AHSA1/START domain
MQKTPTDQQRAFEMSLDIQAAREEVWRALTDAEELIRWFPTRARVTPGHGGTMFWSWEDGWDWETRIEDWQPGRFLRLVQEDARPYDAQGRPLAPGEVESARLVVEFTLETHEGRTRVRVVHSGFGTGAAWDNELDGATEGWQSELRNLRHYLERHRGRDRRLGRARLITARPRDAVWARLIGPEGFRLTPAAPQAGRPYEATAPNGDRLGGTVELFLPRQSFIGTVRELDDVMFRLTTWTDARGNTGIWVILTTYGEDGGRVREFGKLAEERLRKLFEIGR